ncbi:hypothetical protein G7Y89_g10625 [Cudoniella acicularis]|uniref:DUF7924 domain-containing protein n=1 Tax=Cudoniella acicularis TaxID=354080 RepID=A0A8H4RF69_9HELO|nr:hypothetical protein G7Y89_g10625 [Cudoniella acicularis]
MKSTIDCDKPDNTSHTHQRPRTRAQTKLEAEGRKKHLAQQVVSLGRRFSARQRRLQPGELSVDQLLQLRLHEYQTSTKVESRAERNRKRVIKNSQPKKQVEKQVVKKPAKQQTKRKPASTRRQTGQEKSTQQAGKAPATQAQGSDLANWLDRVVPVSPEGLGQEETLSRGPDLDAENRLEDNMNSNSTSRADGSTTQKGGRHGSIKVSLEKLRVRRVLREPKPDSRLEHLNLILTTELPERSLKDIRDLRSVAANFLQQIDENPNDSCYVYIDDFSFHFDEGKSKIHYPIVNRRYFDADLKRCLTKNEAVLQRTIMIHIINQYWLDPIFDWNTKGQWSQPKDTRLPSREDDDISLPKPDLAISFTLNSFTVAEDESDPIPPDLTKCLSPDGGNRCFPFLFFEVKKAGADLQDAYTANLHSASQALYNIYSWMVRSDKEDIFLEQVRVFSVVFNAQDLGVRVHRALKLATGGGAISFQFDEFRPLGRYTKDSACLLMKAIITDYAAKELHPILKATFAETVSQEDGRIANKRKTAAEGASSSKRNRTSMTDITQTGQSFGMSNLNT